MPKPKRKPRKRKVKVSSQARVRKKNDVKNDTLPQIPIKRVIPDNGVTFKVKVRKK